MNYEGSKGKSLLLKMTRENVSEMDKYSHCSFLLIRIVNCPPLASSMFGFDEVHDSRRAALGLPIA